MQILILLYDVKTELEFGLSETKQGHQGLVCRESPSAENSNSCQLNGKSVTL
jgi:hypothetical protein